MGTCDLSKYHSISLYVNDRYYFKLTPDAYVVDIGHSDQCMIALDYNDKDEWLLGEPFFRSFYSVFDDSQGLIGFAPSAAYPESSIFEGVAPSDKLMHPGQEKKAQMEEARKKMPNFSNPLEVIGYVCNTAWS